MIELIAATKAAFAALALIAHLGSAPPPAAEPRWELQEVNSLADLEDCYNGNPPWWAYLTSTIRDLEDNGGGICERTPR